MLLQKSDTRLPITERRIPGNELKHRAASNRHFRRLVVDSSSRLRTSSLGMMTAKISGKYIVKRSCAKPYFSILWHSILIIGSVLLLHTVRFGIAGRCQMEMLASVGLP